MSKLVVALVLFLVCVSVVQAAHYAGYKWGGNGVNVTVYDATTTQGLSDAVAEAVATWNTSSVVNLTSVDVPGDCADRNGAIVICEVEDCGGYWALITLKGNSRISKVRIGLMAGCGEWAFRDYGSRLNAACHELGHALGLAHRDLSAPSCMAHNGTTTPDAHDFETLDAVY